MLKGGEKQPSAFQQAAAMVDLISPEIREGVAAWSARERDMLLQMLGHRDNPISQLILLLNPENTD